LIRDISKIGTKDTAKITFEFDTGKKKTKSIKKTQSPTTHWLFPFDFRQISDLPDEDQTEIITNLPRTLPNRANIWSVFMTYLSPELTRKDINFLQTDVLEIPLPYLRILDKYSDNGGTLGGLLQAMNKLLSQTNNLSQEETQTIKDYIQKVEEIQTRLFNVILSKVYCPSPFPYIRSLQDFEEMHKKFNQKLKTSEMKKFSELENTLQEGDQLWIFHKRMNMRSYAHVAIIGREEKYIHLTAPDRSHEFSSRARICEDSFDKLRADDDRCFVIRPAAPEGTRPTIFRERAEACLGINVDYDAEKCNCETFTRAVHGHWDKGYQVPRGAIQKIISGCNSVAKLTKKLTWTSELPLKTQMWQRFCDRSISLQDLRLPGEVGPSSTSTSNPAATPAPHSTSSSSPSPLPTRTTPPLALTTMPSSPTVPSSSTNSLSTTSSATEVSLSTITSSSEDLSEIIDPTSQSEEANQTQLSTESPMWHGMDWRLGLGLSLGVLGLSVLVLRLRRH